MKSIKLSLIIFSAVLLVGLTSCESNSAKRQDNTHVHEDGSVHSDHAPEAPAPKQESFKVEAESKTTPEPEAKHDHDHSDPNHKH